MHTQPGPAATHAVALPSECQGCKVFTSGRARLCYVTICALVVFRVSDQHDIPRLPS